MCSSEPKIYPPDQHGISRKDIDPDALKIMRRLNRNGFKGYLVGGGVRDLVLGKRPKDFDIATDATPRKIKALFRNCRIIGRRFKLAHVYFRGGKIIEVSTFRDVQDPIDMEDSFKGDHMLIRDNTFGTEVTDAFRRDLTINGLFYDSSTSSVIDYLGGMEDLKNRVVRIIGDPDTRFAEDPVRLIRAVRHAARANFDIDPDCEVSILKNHILILKCSEVRLYEEIKKDLCSGYSFKILQLLAKYRLLQHLLPELMENDCALLRDDSRFGEACQNMDALFRESRDHSATSMLALIALFIGGDSSAENINLLPTFSGREALNDFLKGCFQRFAVPKKENERISHTLQLWTNVKDVPPAELRPSVLNPRSGLPYAIDLVKALDVDQRDSQLTEFLKESLAKQKQRQKGKLNRSRNQRPRKRTGRPRGRGNRK